jgi:D-arabinono-1,4-lactone oxidase
MKMFTSVNGRLYFQPENIQDVNDLIVTAKENNKIIVIQGARHSYPFTDEITKDNPRNIYVLLTYLNKITTHDWDQGIFTVQAGCRIGYDPFDETGVSTLENSLVFQLDPLTNDGRRTVPPGWSLPELGGITHQTIGGFIATGSAGGSIKYAFCDVIKSVRVIYYNGIELVDEIFSRPTASEPNNPFWAVGFANLGLLGFVVEITFQCKPAFNVRGCEITSKRDDSRLNLAGKSNVGKRDVRSFLEGANYTRLLWWPQKEIDKVVEWQANQEMIGDWQSYKPNPYESLPSINGSTEFANKVFGGIFHFLGHTLIKTRCFVEKLFPRHKDAIKRWFDKLNIFLLKIVLSIIAPIREKDFDDAWWQALPMDNEYSDKFAPVEFTELWIPIKETNAVMKTLSDFYADPENAGTFCSEIYAGKKNDFWLSPGYGQEDMIRVDVFWFGRNFGDPKDYFEKFWTLLESFDFRCHWGKYLGPMNTEKIKTLIRKRYCKWGEFMALRRKHDPHGIFLNEYWRNHIDISEDQSDCE